MRAHNGHSAFFRKELRPRSQRAMFVPGPFCLIPSGFRRLAAGIAGDSGILRRFPGRETLRFAFRLGRLIAGFIVTAFAIKFEPDT